MSSAAARPQLDSNVARCPMSPWGKILKRTMDVAGSGLLLIVVAPVIAVIAVLIKLNDGGPIFYRRRVVGRKGQFDAFKLRSMHVDADKILQADPNLRTEFEQNFKIKNDPRITPVSRVIRKLSLDELPQLFNILKGEMSLVGPRMISPEELRKFQEASWIFRQMKPGLTGYWQVFGRQEVSYAKRVEMEIFYVQNWSLLLDLKLLVKTPWRVLRGAGAW